MPGVRQFVLINAAPEHEKEYSVHTEGQALCHVVFHGTSMDRLYAILREGLKVASGGPLQRHGAALGKGIYVSDEPNTALGFANMNVTGATACGWPSSPLHNVRVFLGC